MLLTLSSALGVFAWQTIVLRMNSIIFLQISVPNYFFLNKIVWRILDNKPKSQQSPEKFPQQFVS